MVARNTVSVLLLATLAACSSAKKTEPELAKLEGRKIALLEIEGESTASRVAEVALINELTRRGTFSIVSKEDVQAARRDPDTDTSDWRAVARAAGADCGLKIKVVHFNAEIAEGYSKLQTEDSEYAAEQGKKAKATKLFKVKKLTGKVAYDVEFALGLDKKGAPETRRAIASSEGSEEQEEQVAAARLTPRLRFLETLTGDAFKKFFDRYE